VKLILYKALLAVYAGVFIFSPPLSGIPFGTDKICWLLAMLMAVWNRQMVFGILRVLPVRRILSVCIFLFIVHFFVQLIHGGLSLSSIYRGDWMLLYFDLSKLLMTVPFWISFFALAGRLGLTYEDLFHTFALTLAFWVVSSLLLIAVPSLNDYVMRAILRFEKLDSRILRIHNRGFGFAQGHLFSYGICLSILFSLIAWSSLYQKLYLALYLILSPLLIVVFSFNARIAFVTFGITALIVLFDRRSLLLRFLVVAVGGAAAAVCIIQWGHLMPGGEGVREWLSSGFRQLTGRVNPYEGNNFDSIPDMWHFPTGLNFLVGHGISLNMGSHPFTRSDIGYVTQIYYGGLFYLITLMFSFVALIPFRLLRKKNMQREIFVIQSVFISFCVTNFKGDTFSEVNIFKVYMIVAFMIYLHPRVCLLFRQPNQNRGGRA